MLTSADHQSFEQACPASEDHGRLKPHLLRTPEYCWCDKEAIAQYALGIEQAEFVIEITIHPFKEKLAEIWDHTYKLTLHPVHQDEQGNCYFRRQASLVQYKHADVYEQTKEEVKQHYEVIINKLREEIREAKGQKLPSKNKFSMKFFALG